MEFDLNGNGDIGKKRVIWGSVGPGSWKTLPLILFPVVCGESLPTRVGEGEWEFGGGKGDSEGGLPFLLHTLILSLQISCP